MIDFTEIPYNSSGGDPDLFEKFCCELLNILGYEIIQEPVRGPDGGIDIKVCDIKRNSQNEMLTQIDWLVSCKHFAKSGNAVGVNDELNITDRLSQHKCKGFIGVYSTSATSALQSKLKESTIPHTIIHSSRIEREIVGIYSREKIFARYFPKSYKKWIETYYYLEPIKLFKEYLKHDENSLGSDLEIWFGSIENAIKSIRNSNSFEEIFIENNIKLVYTELLEIDNFWDVREDEIIEAIKTYNVEFNVNVELNMKSYFSYILPQILFGRIGITENFQMPEHFVTSFIYNSAYMKFPNFIFMG